MATIYADFNARTADDRVRLTTVGSQESIRSTGVQAGSWVWLTDGELRVGAQIEEDGGVLSARPAWETTEHLPSEEDLSDREATIEARRKVQESMRETERDLRKVLRYLPLAEHALPPGTGGYIRSRAAEAFGYPELALLAIEEALEKAPSQPGFLHQWLNLLIKVDLDRAVQEANSRARDPMTPAAVLGACVQVIHAYIRQLDESAARAQYEFIISFTERFDSAPGRELTPASVAALVAITRGYAFIYLGDKSRAIAEFTRAITVNPTMAEPYSARGLETYPSDTSIKDLERSLALGMAYYLPAYYLAHFYMHNESWSRAAEFAELTLRFEPPDRVRANVLEWLAIANIQQGGDAELTRRQFQDALRISPDSPHIRKNLEAFEEFIRSKQVRRNLWRVERDSTGGAKELRELAA